MGGIEFVCAGSSQCDYVEFERHGPHPIKCDAPWHVWERVSYVTGCYAHVVGREDVREYGSAYYGCNATNLIIEYFDDSECQKSKATKVVEPCECVDAVDCYSYQVLTCTNPRT